ncbi:MAG: PIG-L family deacetylase [Thermoanaerobaculia bacterium]|nr:PIG-L family deacetylase [Thermoanaerobaculia bacterium]
MRKNLAFLSAVSFVVAPAFAQPPGLGLSPLDSATTGGLPALDRALQKLTQHRRLLVIAAHPDDEDTTILTLTARGQGGEAAYLSLSRGEGGQNLIGPELGVGLGLIRSRELLAARQLDGARQFFTRAYDFGFTRSLDETLEKWPAPVLREDVVRIIRRFRPQVIVTVFPDSTQAGHGQHQAAGRMALETFELAADPAAFPSLTAEGLEPWQPTALFRSAFFDPNAPALEIPTDGIEPFSGRTYVQFAAASRSMHRSQDMGRAQTLGPSKSRYVGLRGPEAPTDLWTGIDTRLEALAALLPAGSVRDLVTAELRAAREIAEAAHGDLGPTTAAELAPSLGRLLDHLHAARSAAPATGAVADLLAEKVAVAEAALLAAAGVGFDVWSDRETLTVGESFRVEGVLWNGNGVLGAIEPLGLDLVGPFTAAPAVDDKGAVITPAGPLPAKALGTWAFTVTPTSAATPSVPYFLSRPLTGDLYDWSTAAPTERGEPFGAPTLMARLRFRVAGRELVVEREVVQRLSDQARGEVRRPLRLVPRLEVSVEPNLVVWPIEQRSAKKLRVHLRSNAGVPLTGTVRLEVPAGWPKPTAVPFAIGDPRGDAALEFEVHPPASLAAGRASLGVVAEVAGERFTAAYPVIDYPHVRPTPEPRPARVEVSATDLVFPPLRRIAYVRGASDRVPEALLALGLPLELVTGEDVATRDLAGYDALVIGTRTYEVDADLVRANARIQEFASRGGLVLVLYQQYPYVTAKVAPYPLDIGRPHDRVTDENAPARALVPDHPVFSRPNRIGPGDWQGWVQERGLYFAKTWDPAFTPLLGFPDAAGTAELQGGLLVAKVGKGTYVYTGLAFFRQLPVGVPGAYRLFANLLALGDGVPLQPKP